MRPLLASPVLWGASAVAAHAQVCGKTTIDWSFGLGGIPDPNLSVWAVLPMIMAGFLFVLSWGLIKGRWITTALTLGLAVLAFRNIADWYWWGFGIPQFAHADGCRASPVVAGGLLLLLAAALVCVRGKGPAKTTSSDS